MTKQRLIDEFHKNSVEVIKIHVQEWRGQDYVDMRVWYSDRAGQNGAENVTRKGLTIRVELLPDLIRALEKTQAFIDGVDLKETRSEGKCGANAEGSIQDPCPDSGGV